MTGGAGLMTGGAGVMTGAVLLVGHGSPDPRFGEALAQVADGVRALLPGTAVALGFLESTRPTVAQAVGGLPPGEVIVVPLLLAEGYHTRTDLPLQLNPLQLNQLHLNPPHLNPLGRSRFDVTPALGPDPLLEAALARRVAEAGIDGDGWHVVRASARTPVAQVADQVAAAREEGARRVAIAAYLLAPGRFHDGLLAAGADRVTEPLAGTPELLELVLQRAQSSRGAEVVPIR